MRATSNFRLVAALLPALAIAPIAVGQTGQVQRRFTRQLHSAKPLAAAPPVAINRDPAIQLVPAADPCIQCDVIYAVNTSGNFGDPHFWVIDPDAGTATWIGSMAFGTYFDIAISADGDLYGLSASEDLQRIDACTFQAPGTQVLLVGGNSLAGDVTGPELYIAGAPRMIVYDTQTDTDEQRGTFPTNWCDGGGGILSGDLAMSPDPADGLLYGTMLCSSCPSGDTLVSIDPATGDMVDEIGCIQDAGGTQYGSVFGLAFDPECRLFGGVAGDPFDPSAVPFILEIDTTTGVATRIDIVSTNTNIWGETYFGTNGLASLPCAPCATVEPEPPTCEPLTQGFWKRQCRGTHPSGESENLDEYAACAGQRQTFGGVATAAQVCDELNPDPRRSKCEQARAQFMALVLNVCSGRLGEECCIDSDWTSATTVGQAMDEIDALLASPLANFDACVLAQGIADDINTAHALCPVPEPAP